MEKLLQQIVDIEKDAQRMVEEAKKRRDAMNDEIAAESDALRKKYREMAETRLDMVTEQEAKLKAEEIEHLKADYAARLEKLNEMFRLHQQEWISQICGTILGR